MNEDNNIWEPKSGRVDTESNNVQSSKLNTNSLDLDFRRVLSIWPFILLFGLFGYAIGRIYLRYATTIYSVSTSISFNRYHCSVLL